MAADRSIESSQQYPFTCAWFRGVQPKLRIPEAEGSKEKLLAIK